MENNEWLVRAHVDTPSGPKTAVWPAMNEDMAYTFASTIALDRARTELDTDRHSRISALCSEGRYKDAVQLWNSIMEFEKRDLAIITIDQRTDDTTDSNVDVDRGYPRRRAV